MTVNVPFQYNGSMSVFFSRLNQLLIIPYLLRSWQSTFTIFYTLIQEIRSLVSLDREDEYYERDPEYADLEAPIELSVLEGLGSEEAQIAPEKDASENVHIAVHESVVKGPVIPKVEVCHGRHN